MSLRVMTLVGCLVFVPGFMMFWPAPAATSQPRSVADRYECREPQGKLFCRPAEISYGPSRCCSFA